MRRYKVIVTPGAQDGISKLFDAILDIGDYVVMEDAGYPGTITAVSAQALYLYSVIY